MTKRRLLAVGFLVFACLACLRLVSHARAAAPGYGRPVPPLSVPVSEPAHPDLVVREIRATQFSPGFVPGVNLTVVVKNIGAAASAPCMLVLRHTRNITVPNSSKVLHTQLLTLLPGAATSANFHMSPISIPWKGMLIAVVDPAVAGKPSGQLFEGSAGELNNLFGFTFNTGTSPPLPIVWKNPPVPVSGEPPHPDPAVTNVRLAQFINPATAPRAEAYVRFKNIGTLACAEYPDMFNVVLEYTPNILEPESSKVVVDWRQGVLVPGTEAGQAFHFDNVTIPWQGMLIAIIDAPLAPPVGTPSGALAEYSGEFNNVFGFTFKAQSAPRIWKNPAVQ